MNTDIMVKKNYVLKSTKKRNFTFMEVFTLKLFHPRALLIICGGLIWSLYYFWHYDWVMALEIFASVVILTPLLVVDIIPEEFAKTTWGKIALLHLHPLNLPFRIVGTALVLFGVWQRSLVAGLLGVTFVLLGHTFGWSKVDPRLASELEMTDLDY